MYRWVQAYAPELEKRCRPQLKSTNDSWRVDETYIETEVRRRKIPPPNLLVKGKQKYLYRAIDSTGQTLDFLLIAKRDAQAVKRFFHKALRAVHNQEPRVINVDKNAAYPKAIDELKEKQELSERVELRQNKYLNNRVKQDHRFIKWLVKPGMGFKSFNKARRTIKGYEAMHVLKKGQIEEIEKGAVKEQAKFVAKIFGVAA